MKNPTSFGNARQFPLVDGAPVDLIQDVDYCYVNEELEATSLFKCVMMQNSFEIVKLSYCHATSDQNTLIFAISILQTAYEYGPCSYWQRCISDDLVILVGIWNIDGTEALHFLF